MLSLVDLFHSLIAWAELHRPLTGLLGLFTLGVILDLCSADRRKTAFIDRRDRVQAYAAALVLSYVLDWIVAGLLPSQLEWQYSTHIVVEYFLVGREGVLQLNFIAQRGLDIPILRDRLAKLMSLDADHESVEEIRQLVAELRSLRGSRPAGADPPDGPDSPQEPTI